MTAKRKTTAPNTAVMGEPAAKSHLAHGKVLEKAKDRQLADLAMRPSFNAAAVAVEYLSKPGGVLSVTSMMDSLTDSMKAVRANDMSRPEEMLFAQAHALQAIFLEMARRAAKHEQPEHRESSLRMALKAQNQCRMTLETLATIKNPPVLIARQANISNGPQQVNNGIARQRAARSHAGNRQKRQNELLEVSHEQGVDAGTAGPAGGADARVEAMASVDRPAHR